MLHLCRPFNKIVAGAKLSPDKYTVLSQSGAPVKGEWSVQGHHAEEHVARRFADQMNLHPTLRVVIAAPGEDPLATDEFAFDVTVRVRANGVVEAQRVADGLSAQLFADEDVLEVGLEPARPIVETLPKTGEV